MIVFVWKILIFATAEIGPRFQEAAGLVLTETDLMTGLPEYRNGGLLLDMGLLQAKHEGVTGKAHAPEEEVRPRCDRGQQIRGGGGA